MNLLSTLIFLCAAVSCLARPNGAPTSACSSLTPSHSGLEPQRDRPPYSVTAVKSGNKVRVTISSSTGEEFEGFVLQARSNSDRSRIVEGTFTSSQPAKTIDCFRGRQNTLTQKGANPKTEIITEWTPSNGVNEDVIFRATVAKTFALFWTEIDSVPVRIGSGGGNSRPTSQGASSSQSIYYGCSVSKSCFGYPSDCVRREDCEILLDFVKVPDGIRFNMYGYIEPQTYMAMAFSSDARMGDDAVTECIREGPDLIARNSWNERDKRNTGTRELPRNSYSSSYRDGLSTCSWTAQPLHTSVNGRRYNLANNTHYILLAKGPTRDGALGYHDGRLSSAEAINLTAIEGIEGEGVSDAVKVHGTFMITAWVGFVSLGILLARHFKNTWEDSTLCGVKIWFAFHRGFMLIALVFVVIAFIVIFVHRNGWSPTSNPHAILGCIATALGLFQPIMALFRPSPDHPKRPIFNWLHWLVGNAAQIIAVITIFFAVSLEASGLKDSFYWVMAVFVIVHLIFHFLLQVHLWNSKKKKSTELNMNEMSGAGRANNIQNMQAKNVTDNVFRILLLGIYSIFLLVILLALYCLIGVA